MINKLGAESFWVENINLIKDWIMTRVATVDTLIELSTILVAAILAIISVKTIRTSTNQYAALKSSSALLNRLKDSADRIVFPLLLLGYLSVFNLILSYIEYRHSLVGIVNSLSAAWVIINIASLFVVNPLASKFIALSAWLVAALNILGFLDDVLAFLQQATLSLGQAKLSALTILQAILALVVLLWVTSLAGQIIEGRLKQSTNLSESFKVLSAKLLRIALAVIALIIALTIVGIDLTVFAVFGGAIGVGLGFGLQKIFANLISGFILLADKSIKPGDVIALGDDYGKVDALGARYVSVLTRDGIEHLIPNEELITTKVENWSHSSNLLRVHKMIGVHYQSDIRLAVDLCKQAMSETPRILKEPAPNCLVKDFADNSVNIEMRFWIQDPMNGLANVKSDLLLNVWDKLHENNIEIPYPQRDLHIRSSAINNNILKPNDSSNDE
ncbi:mechanosensitive ion channel family protein [Aliikangiella sp. IMCC44632]